MKKQEEPEQFYFVEVHAQLCTPDELQLHLSEFGKTFIDQNQIDRWLHVTQERPEKASDELGKLLWGVDEKYQQLLGGSSGFPYSLERRFGSKRGVYFDGIDEPCKVTAVEASTLAAERSNDALFSLTPGRLAIFFFHHGDVVLFEKVQLRIFACWKLTTIMRVAQLYNLKVNFLTKSFRVLMQRRARDILSFLT